MAKFLQQLLKINEPTFSVGMSQLEKATGSSGVDTRLIADITHKAHDIMRHLGLDPADSTGRELYQALVSSVKRGTFEKLLVNADYVMMSFVGEPVSFNLIDVIENAHHELTFEQRIMSHGQRSLRGEIVQRYLQHSSVDESVTLDVASETGLLPETDKMYKESEAIFKESASDTPSVLAIGDIFTDAFIKLREDKARIDTDPDGSKRLSMEFGSKPPYEQVDIVQAVGPSPNAAVSLSRLGLRVGLLAFLGDDQPGKDSLTKLQSEGVDTSIMSIKQGMKSNYYYVLRYGADRTILVKNENYDYVWREPREVPDWIYLSLISAASWQLHEDLLTYLEAHPATKLAFQPGTFHFEWGIDKLSRVYKRSYIVVMNREEAALVTGKTTESVRDLALALHELGPQIVVITDGPAGSYVSGDYKFLSMPNYPDPAPPYDRTGAGDAFASTIVAALALGESLETAMTWAPINSMSVVQKLGAQAGLLNATELKSYLNKAPDDYKIKEL